MSASPSVAKGARLRGIAACFCALVAAPIALPSAARADDPRLVERFYDPGKVYKIYGRPKVQTTITFGDGEKIENVAIGDSNAWQVTPNKRANILFVKPLSSSAATNMTVVTNKHTYLFDLVTSTKSRPIYVLSFTYPPEPDPPPQSASAQSALAGGLSPDELAATNDPLAVIDAAQLNFAWKASGDKALLPARIFDDGSATFLAWPKDVALPAILVTNDQGEEGPVNYTVRDDVIVIGAVPRKIVLRMGGDKAELLNQGPPRASAPVAQPALATIRELADSSAPRSSPLMSSQTQSTPYYVPKGAD